MNLQLESATAALPVGEAFHVDILARSPSNAAQPFAFTEIILEWDTEQLQLVDVSRPCETKPCPEGTYFWLDLGFPSPSPAGLNDSLTDGNAILWAVAQFPPKPPALATAEGLRIARLRFDTRAPGAAQVHMEPSFGLAETKVIHDGLDITGTLGSPIQVFLVRCLTPTVEVLGSRYLRITPAAQPEPVALRLNGAPPSNENVNCVSLYVQPDGSLDRHPATQAPETWGSVLVTGSTVIPGARYDLRADCSAAHEAFVLSPPFSVSTWKYGDVNGDGAVLIDDLFLVIDAADGVLPPGARPEQFDVAPCLPDGVVNDADVADVEAAAGGSADPCPPPCVREQWLAAYQRFAICLISPFPPPKSCAAFDVDPDGSINLRDFQDFQQAFGGPISPPIATLP